MVQLASNGLPMFFKKLSFANVSVNNRQDSLAIDCTARHQGLGRKFLTVLPLSPNFTVVTHEPVRTAIPRRKIAQVFSVFLSVTHRKKHFDGVADHLICGVAKRTLGRRVEEQDSPTLVRANY